MKMLKLLVAVVFTALCLVANATEGKWVSGFGQGNMEYFTDKGDARLYIGCPSRDSNDGSDSTVSLIINGKHVEPFKIIVGSKTYSGPFRTGTHYSTASFIDLIDDLNKNDAKVVYGKTEVLFPKSNIKNVLHTYMSGKLSCAIN